MNADRPPMLESHANGLILRIVAAPGAKKSQIMGLYDGLPRIALAAPPREGRANDALIEFVAALAKLPKRNVEILKGDASKRKSLLLRTPHREATAQAITDAVRDSKRADR
jgi:uncharacterized protein (TIGR00251 family)